jgi:hypothetical protein
MGSLEPFALAGLGPRSSQSPPPCLFEKFILLCKYFREKKKNPEISDLEEKSVEIV